MRIEGTNIEKAGYAPGRLVQKTSSLSRLPSGSFIMNFGYFMEDFYSCPGEPEGASDGKSGTFPGGDGRDYAGGGR